jgi:hypothetical protein
MGLVRNLKKTLNNLADKILVELSYHYIKQRAKQTLRRPDDSSSIMFSQSPLTTESQRSTIATSSTGTSEKIIMTATTEDIVAHIRDWAINKVEEYNGKGVDRIYDQMAIMEEFDEWINPEEDFEVVSLEQ